MEILRGDLARLLHEPARERAAYRFGDGVERIEDGPGGASVTFAGGATGTYDLVIVAEGVGSRTRERVFRGENDPRRMNLTIAYFTVPHVADDDRMWRRYNATGGGAASRCGPTRAAPRAPASPSSSPRAGSRTGTWIAGRLACARFAGAGWQADRVIAGMGTTDDFYFDVLRRVRMRRWSKGRVVLTGDAAWCATPLPGIGTALSVTGAYVLAPTCWRLRAGGRVGADR